MSALAISRRGAALGASGLILGAAAFVSFGGRDAFYAAMTEPVDGDQIDARVAHAGAIAGDITLIDIRRPEEWSATGSGEGAIRLDMRREDFVAELGKIIGDKTRPVALICARGVRSARLSNRLSEAGFTNVIDVPEGMLGSAAGPGWIARGLPLEKR